MKRELLEELRNITPEEKKILQGQKNIQKDIYMSSKEDIIDANLFLEVGKLIQIRPHTRFVHFPKHTHNYIEIIYMCTGSTHHVIDGNDVILNEGELLFLNQKVVQEIYPAGEEDIAVNFIILPEFFDYGLKMIEGEKSLIKDFIVDSLKGVNNASGYMHFKVMDVLPIQNLMENLIWTIWNKNSNRRSINEATIGVLFLHLMNYMDRMDTNAENEQQKLVITVLHYIDGHYRDGGLSELAKELHYDLHWLSKEIKRLTGKNYTELVQEKKLSQARFLLEYTEISIMEIGMAIGYDNMSYFHKIFKEKYGITPRRYRLRKS